MRYRPRHAMLAAALASLILSSLPAQPQDANSAFSALQAASDRLQAVVHDRRGTRTPLVGVEAEDINLLNKQINTLQGRYRSRAATTPPANAEYVDSLQHLVRLINLAAQESRPAESRAILKDVTGDLADKLGRGEVGFAASERPFRWEAQVTVKTMKDGNQVQGYFVYANPIRWQNADPRNPFSKLSSPTSRMLTPGRYEIVASKDGVVARRLADIGLAGPEPDEIEVPVP